MPIRLPLRRCYYAASPAEKDIVLCWIPPEELEILSSTGTIHQSVTEDFPLGLEIEVSQAAFEQVGLDVGVPADRIRGEYIALSDGKLLAASGIVDGLALEQNARASVSRTYRLDGPTDAPPIAGCAPEPPMSEGDSPVTVFRRIASSRSEP